MWRKSSVYLTQRLAAPLFRTAERALLKEFSRHYQEMLAEVAADLEAGRAPSLGPTQRRHEEAVQKHLVALYEWGYNHAGREIARQVRRPLQQFADPKRPRGPKPAEAIAWAQSRVALQGKWSRDLDAQVNAVIVEGLSEGLTNRDIMKRLKTVFPNFGKARLENIARTETASAYNAGRIGKFRESLDTVAVQFTAIIDDRTTRICQARDGLIMMLDDPRIDANTPPLHFQCRSTLVPVSRYDFEDLQAGDPEIVQRYFGWLEGGPQNLKDALDWDKAPEPLAGFGGQPASKTDLQLSGREQIDNGIGYRIQPLPTDLRNRQVTVNLIGKPDVSVLVQNVWEATGELATVRKALYKVPSSWIEGLEAIEFVPSLEKILRISGPTTIRGAYSKSLSRIFLSRSADRDFTRLANDLNQRLAKATVVHEIGHHVWKQRPEIREAFRMMVSDPDPEEIFCKNLAYWFWNRSVVPILWRTWYAEITNEATTFTKKHKRRNRRVRARRRRIRS